MMLKMDAQKGAGGGMALPDLTQMQQSSTNDQFPATVGKTYLILQVHGGGGGNVSSGGTVESYFQYQPPASQYVYLAIIKATAATVNMTGSGNTIYYLQLD